MKKVLFYALLLPAAVGMMFSCSEAKTDVRNLEGKWTVTEVKGEDVQQKGEPQMEFNITESKLHGNSGCNIFNTTINLDSSDISAITINQAATTMMACPNMDLEMQVLRAMEEVKSVKAGKSDKEMMLIDEAGAVLFVLSKN